MKSSAVTKLDGKRIGVVGIGDVGTRVTQEFLAANADIRYIAARNNPYRSQDSNFIPDIANAGCFPLRRVE